MGVKYGKKFDKNFKMLYIVKAKGGFYGRRAPDRLAYPPIAVLKALAGGHF